MWEASTAGFENELCLLIKHLYAKHISLWVGIFVRKLETLWKKAVQIAGPTEISTLRVGYNLNYARGFAATYKEERTMKKKLKTWEELEEKQNL